MHIKGSHLLQSDLNWEFIQPVLCLKSDHTIIGAKSAVENVRLTKVCQNRQNFNCTPLGLYHSQMILGAVIALLIVQLSLENKIKTLLQKEFGILKLRERYSHP